MRTVLLLLASSCTAFAEEPPVAWSDDPPVAWTDKPAVAALPPIDFDLRALNAAPAVAAPAAFRRGSFYAGHDCPECGRIVLAKSGSAGRGQHWHVCPADGCYWRHDDK